MAAKKVCMELWEKTLIFYFQSAQSSQIKKQASRYLCVKKVSACYCFLEGKAVAAMNRSKARSIVRLKKRHLGSRAKTRSFILKWSLSPTSGLSASQMLARR